MRKTFTVSGPKSFTAEGESKVDIALRYGVSMDDVKGPRFTDSLRSKPKAGKAAKRNTPNEAAQEVHYFGNRAAVRHLARL